MQKMTMVLYFKKRVSKKKERKLAIMKFAFPWLEKTD